MFLAGWYGMYLCKWKRVYKFENSICDRAVSVLIEKTLFSSCLHTESNIMSLHITCCVTVPVSRLCHPSGDVVWRSNRCQPQLIEGKKASWGLPVYWDFRVYCSICHRPTSNSSDLSCYSRCSTVWIQARTWNCSVLVTQIDDILLSVDRGQSLIFILLALYTTFDESGQKSMLSCQGGVAGSKAKC